MSNQSPRTGGQLLVDALKVHGVDLAFGVPGESYLAVLDAMHDVRETMRFIICRQEGGASYMAEAYGKLTGRPGICFVTRGPGATNGAIGVHVAYQDSTPMILFVGQVGNDFVEREAFQEIDYRRMYGPMAKWVAQIDRADRVPEYVNRAFHTAVSGRPGPVVLALPEDMLTDTAAVANTGRYKRVAANPGDGDMRKLRDMLAQAQRPFVILGGGDWNAEACADIRAFIEANGLPVGTAFRRADLYDNRLPNYVGDVGIGINPALAERVKGCDLLIAVGPRLDEMTTGGYTLIDVPRPKQKFVHVHPGAEELGRVYEADLPINSGMPEFAAMARGLKPVNSSAWQEGTRAARKEYEAWLEPGPAPGDGRFRQGDDVAAQAPAARDHRHQRRRQFCGLGASLLSVHRLPDRARADRGLDGLRGARRHRRRAGAPRAAGRRVLRRRRFPHDRAGAGDRRAVRREGDVHRRQQRHVRDDTHAPGA